MDEDWVKRDLIYAFEDVIGQDLVVQDLARRVREKDLGANIVFWGPEGTGKRTVAWVYAQALQCEQPADSGSPCQTCIYCDAMRAQQFFNYVELNADEGLTREVLVNLIEQAEKGFLGAERSIVLIENASGLPNELVDLILKTIESVRDVIFIFSTSDLWSLNSALRSRCQPHQIKPLTKDLARFRLNAICDREGYQYEDEALDVVIEQARCAAGSLLYRLHDVAMLGDVTLEKARDAFGLRWPHEMKTCWEALADGNELGAEQILRAMNDNALEVVRRVRVFVTFLDVWWLHRRAAPAVDPAFCHIADEFGTELHQKMKGIAVARRQSFSAFWQEAISYWAEADVYEWNGLVQAVRYFGGLLR